MLYAGIIPTDTHGPRAAHPAEPGRWPRTHRLTLGSLPKGPAPCEMRRTITSWNWDRFIARWFDWLMIVYFPHVPCWLLSCKKRHHDLLWWKITTKMSSKFSVRQAAGFFTRSLGARPYIFACFERKSNVRFWMDTVMRVFHVFGSIYWESTFLRGTL